MSDICKQLFIKEQKSARFYFSWKIPINLAAIFSRLNSHLVAPVLVEASA